MPSCAFTNCKNHTKRNNKSDGITFHSFPGDELMEYKWLIVVRTQRQQPEWIPNRHSRVCSAHFKPEDIHTTKKGYRRLSHTAVPLLWPTRETADCTPQEPMSLNSLNTSIISDLESVFDSTRNACLERKLFTEIIKKRKLMLDNKNLKKRVNRLIQKCKNLKAALVQSKNIINNLNQSSDTGMQKEEIMSVLIEMPTENTTHEERQNENGNL